MILVGRLKNYLKSCYWNNWFVNIASNLGSLHAYSKENFHLQDMIQVLQVKDYNEEKIKSFGQIH